MMYKHLLFILCGFLVFAQVLKGQNFDITTTITAGELSSKFTANQLSYCSSLTIKGTMDARDFKTLQASRKNLLVLDLTDVSILAYEGEGGPSGNRLYATDEIPEDGLSGFESLWSLSLPKSLKNIGTIEYLFFPALTTISIETNNYYSTQNYGGNNKILFDKNKTKLILCPPDFASEKLYIPQTVNVIGEYAFRGTKISSIVLSDKLECIERYAFYGNENLTGIYIPEGLETIEEYALSKCKSLTTLKIPSSVRKIGNSFVSSTPLKSLYFENSQPMDISPDVFEGLDLTSCILYVPEGAAEFYRNKTGWKNFIRIEEFKEFSEITEISLEAGNFSDFITPDFQRIEKLRIKGTMNNKDFITLRYCMPMVRFLDLTDVLVGKRTEEETFSPLNEIPEEAFSGMLSLSEVILPSGTKEIKTRAFSGCNDIETISLPEGLKIIGNYAFSGCSNIREIFLPSSVETLENYVFYGCNSLQSLTIPKSLININARYLTYGSGIKEFIQEEENPNFSVKDGMLFNKNQTILLCCPNKKEGSITIPSGTLEIGERAFNYCENIISIVLNTSLTTIGDHCFYYCDKLESIELSSGVTKIGEEAFGNCYSLKKIDIPAGVRYIGGRCFIMCSSLEIVLLQYTSIAEIPYECFSHCTELYTVKLPESLLMIDEMAFYNCHSLESLILPESLEIIENRTFVNCTKLRSIGFPDKIKKVSYDSFHGCSQLESVKFSENTEIIELGAFSFCENLSYLKLPASLRIIKWQAFLDCKKLARIDSYNPAPPTLEEGAFYGVDPYYCDVYVPKGSMKEYQRAIGWRDFKFIEEMTSTSLSSVSEDDCKIFFSPDGETLLFEGLDGSFKATVTDFNGRIVIPFQVPDTGKLATAHLPTGVYFVTVTNGKEKITRKILK